MSVCVIADEERLGARISQALVAIGEECPSDHIVRVAQAEQYLIRNHPDLVLVAGGRDIQEATSTFSRLRDLTVGHLLAVGPVLDPKLVLGILRSGVADYVDEAALETELASALTRLKTARVGRASPGRLIAVVGPSGGSGASLIAANLAVAMAKLKERCLLIDLKSRTGDLAAFLNLKPSHTMQDLCRVASRIDRVLFEQTLSSHPTGVGLLASPRSYEAASSVEAMIRIFDLGRALFPRILVDVDPSLPEETMETLRQANHVLIIMRLEFNSLRNAKTLLDHLERCGHDPRKILLIANRVGQPKEIPAAKVQEALGRKFYAMVPDDPKSALGSQNNGVPAMTEYPSSYFSKALRTLAAAINGLENPLSGS